MVGNLRSNCVAIAVGLASLIGPVSRSRAATLTADYSGLGTVFQDSAGLLYSSAGAGRADVTANIKTDIAASFTYLQNAVTLPWNETIHFQLTDLTGEGAVADSGINNVDANGRPSDSTIRISTGYSNFVDPTPFNNSEFVMKTGSIALGGGQVNNKVFGDSAALKATSTYDFLTLVMHETEHSMGISSGLDRFVALAGPSNSAPNAPDRALVISKALSGLPSDYSIPIRADSAHYIGDPDANDPFGFAVVADPGWQFGQRALPTALDIEGIGQVEGATANDINLNYLSVTPEPTSLALLGAGGLLLLHRRRRAR